MVPEDQAPDIDTTEDDADDDTASEVLDIEGPDDADQGNDDSNDDDTEVGDGTEGEVPTNTGD